MSGTLSVSGGALDESCHRVLQAMVRLRISGDVTPNMTVCDGRREHGCRIVFSSPSPKDTCFALWTALRSELGLTCAHVRLSSQEEGCALNVFAPSRCPLSPSGTACAGPGS